MRAILGSVSSFSNLPGNGTILEQIHYVSDFKSSFLLCHQVQLLSGLPGVAERAQRLRGPTWGHRGEPYVSDHHGAGSVHTRAQDGEKIGELSYQAGAANSSYPQFFIWLLFVFCWDVVHIFKHWKNDSFRQAKKMAVLCLASLRMLFLRKWGHCRLNTDTPKD